MKRWLVVVLAGAALAGGLVRGWNRYQASRTLRFIEARSVQIVQRGQARPADLIAHARTLERATKQDPANVAIVMSEGSQYLLLGRTGSAIELYQRALELEPRPEIYLNLGRAYWFLGRKGRARGYFQQAVQLDPPLARQLPPGAATQGSTDGDDETP